MRVLVAPDCYTGTLTAPEAAEALAAGWLAGAPGDQVERCPLSDGGPGFVEVLAEALAGTMHHERVSGPTGETVRAQILLHVGSDGVPTAYLESAHACGAHLVPPGLRDPGRTGTGGVGQLLVRARRLGARRIVVGLGGSGTNDAGAGMLLALAAADALADTDALAAAEALAYTEALAPDGPRAAHRLGSGGAGLRGVTPADLHFLAPLRERWRDVELVAATDVDSPLLGPRGASLGYSPQKGACPQRARELEAALGDFAQAVGVLRPDLSADLPGAGAAGGLGFALALLGARRARGADTVMSAVGFSGRVAGRDLVVTGEGRFDWQSLRGKVVSAVAARGLAAGVPVVVVPGQVAPGPVPDLPGVRAVHPVVRDAGDPASARALARALSDPRAALAGTARRIARATASGERS
ncbi:MAG: glycerate kinase [Actinomycetota bacterium]|nr:glycerate kinase [Actinomycetota bacterium]